jgi:anaerobic selenocysteine-containing dehydrogenase
MRISRRAFLKYCTIAAGALGLTGADLLKLEKALASETQPQVF